MAALLDTLFEKMLLGLELYEMYGVRFKLNLWVKVEKDWRKNFWMLKKFGYA